MDPAVSFQTAVRAALIASPAVTALVAPNDIRASSLRPDGAPTIRLTNPRCEHMGRDAAGRFVSKCKIDINVFALEDGAEAAQQIGGTVAAILFDAPEGVDQTNWDDYERPSFHYIDDPDPDFARTRGVAIVSGVITWSL